MGAPRLHKDLNEKYFWETLFMSAVPHHGRQGRAPVIAAMQKFNLPAAK